MKPGYIPSNSSTLVELSIPGFSSGYPILNTSIQWLWLDKMALVAKSFYLMKKSQRVRLTFLPLNNLVAHKILLLSKQEVSLAMHVEGKDLVPNSGSP